MKAAEEFANRNNCRNRVGGVLVPMDGRGLAQAVKSWFWDEASSLIVVLTDGDKNPANRCHLRSKWPVSCFPPDE